MKVSVVLVGRNDDYGGRQVERVNYSINCMLDTFDEIIYVDWNTEGSETLTDVLDIRVHPEKLTIITVPPSQCRELMGEHEYTHGQKCCEVLARNIGIRRATGDIIVDSNTDIIPPKREHLNVLLKDTRIGDMWTIAKHDVEVDVLHKMYEQTRSYMNVRDLIPIHYGVNPISARLICPFLEMNKQTLLQLPPEHHHVASSLICACGDMQIARKETWYAIKGFEESMIKRMYVDSIVQYKVIMNGGTVRATNFPPIYHIEHARDNSPSVQNVQQPETGKNLDTWGFSDIKFKTTYKV